MSVDELANRFDNSLSISKQKCGKSLSCGHHCNGVEGEQSCICCLHCNKGNGGLEMAGEKCAICHEEYDSFSCIQLKCGHVFHHRCCESILQKRWTGPRISFGYMFCCMCKSATMDHPMLNEVYAPSSKLYEDVKAKCNARLEYENKKSCNDLTNPSSQWYKKPFEYAMHNYCYYECCKCKEGYYGGDAKCMEEVNMKSEYNPAELVCSGCTEMPADRPKTCDKHGKDFIGFKCRFCCSYAVYFCFGTTHFCNPCHNDHTRLTKMKMAEFPQCPVAPQAKPMDGNECPLKVKHPPTGEEFCLGCAICINIKSF